MWLREEILTRKRTGISHLSDEVVSKLMLSLAKDDEPTIDEDDDKQQKTIEKLMGDYNYDILGQRLKAQEFMYVPHHFEDRAKYVTSDAIKEDEN